MVFFIPAKTVNKTREDKDLEKRVYFFSHIFANFCLERIGIQY